MLVEVRPLPLKKWHGKTGKESFTQPKIVEALVNPETRRLETGLTEQEAEEYGKKLGVNLSDLFIEETHGDSWWASKPAWIELPDRTLVFDTSKPKDYIAVKLLKSKSAPQVANSQADYDKGLYPQATHVIFDEEEQAEILATKFELKIKAYNEAAKLPQEGKASIVHVMTNKSVKSNSVNWVNAKIEELIEQDPAQFMKILQMGKEYITLKSQVLDLLHNRIFTKGTGGAIHYLGEMIAFDTEDAIKWLRDPNNSQIKVLILDKLNKHKGV